MLNRINVALGRGRVEIYKVSETIRPLCRDARKCLKILSDTDISWEDADQKLPKFVKSCGVTWNDHKPYKLVTHRTELKLPPEKPTYVATVYSIKMPLNCGTSEFAWQELLKIWADGYVVSDNYTIKDVLKFIRAQFSDDCAA